MQMMKARALAGQAVALTLRHWRAFLASAAVFLVIFGLAVVLPMSYAESRLAANADAGLVFLILLAALATWVALAAFQYCWLRSLTDGNARPCVTFPGAVGFWKYLGLVFPSIFILFIITGDIAAQFLGPAALGFGYAGMLGVGSLIPFLLNLALIWFLLRWHLALMPLVATGRVGGLGQAWRAGRAANPPLLGWSAVLALLLLIWETLKAFLQMTTSTAQSPAVMLTEIALGLLLLALVNAGLCILSRPLSAATPPTSPP